MSQPTIGIIVGSNRPGRIGRHIADWVMQSMEHPGLTLQIIDLAEVNLPFLDEHETADNHHYEHEHTRRWSETITACDGFVFVYPQYNWGYPAVLKNALDFLYDEWGRKPVSLMCYGGHGGFQGLIALKLVTQGLRMYNMATNPPLSIDDEMFDDKGQFKNIETALGRYRNTMQLVSNEFIDLLGTN